MNFRAPQTFIGINVADAAHHGLVQQDRLDARLARLNPRAKFAFAHFQRFQPQAAEDAFVRAVCQQRHAPEPAHIVVAKFAAVIEREEHVGVQRARASPADRR